MALTKAGLSAAIIAAQGAAQDTATQQAEADKLADAIVTYLKANAVVVVNTSALVAPSGGGPVTGTATGTLT